MRASRAARRTSWDESWLSCARGSSLHDGFDTTWRRTVSSSSSTRRSNVSLVARGWAATMRRTGPRSRRPTIPPATAAGRVG